MPYVLCGPTQAGKSHMAKELIKKLQLETPHPVLLLLLVSFPDEFRMGQANTDNTVYLKRGSQMKIYDKSKYQYKLLLQQAVRDAFNEDFKRFYKIIFIDDNTTDINNKDPALIKIYSEGRHKNIDIIQSLHYINSIYTNLKAYIKDYFLFQNQTMEKMKKFYKDELSQYFSRPDQITYDGEEIEGYNFEKFWQQLEDWMGGSLAPDDPNRTKYWHRSIQIKLPTKQDPRSIIVFIEPDKQYEQIITSNGLYQLMDNNN